VTNRRPGASFPLVTSSELVGSKRIDEAPAFWYG